MQDSSTRAQIVLAADQLFYERGFSKTSFADVASAVGISRGNFYHHFKSKDAILQAVIAQRCENTRAMLAEWEGDGSTPQERILCYARIVIRNRAKIVQYGCPVGSLTTELAKLDHALLDDANSIFTLFRDWLASQFCALGKRSDAEHLALHVLSWSQGVATLASAFKDEAFIDREVAQFEDWLNHVVSDKQN